MNEISFGWSVNLYFAKKKKKKNFLNYFGNMEAKTWAGSTRPRSNKIGLADSRSKQRNYCRKLLLPTLSSSPLLSIVKAFFCEANGSSAELVYISFDLLQLILWPTFFSYSLPSSGTMLYLLLFYNSFIFLLTVVH